jgi:2-oxoglutarate dehydrogenase E1 component
MKDFQYITSSHPSYVENLYQEFRKDPSSVDQEFRKFFEGFDFALSMQGNGSFAATKVSVPAGSIAKEFAVYNLIQSYRSRGHLVAHTNPIRKRKDRHANLELSHFGLAENDLEESFEAGKIAGLSQSKLKDIIQHLERCYAGNTGMEYAYIHDSAKKVWLEKAMEEEMLKPLEIDQQRRTLEKLNEGVMFEKFLHTKYIGQKRFSLEGGESTIPALDSIISEASMHDVKEVVIGMAHRGRLNILANIMGKTYEQIFTEFEGVAPVDSTMGSGDVKYHLGFSSEVETTVGKKIHLKLCPNPSHLEAVNPVVSGYARSMADVIYNSDYSKVLPIQIHGDASIAGQGIVYEVLQMSKLKGYDTGGTIHFVINNQIGFTTDFDDARSADYCTSVAAMVQAPVFHVNGDDPESVVRIARLATRYRQQFGTDIFIDMVCYRRHGHNEGDEPKFTQPGLYAIIDKHPNPREIYTRSLMEKGNTEAQDLAKEMEKKFLSDLQQRLDEVKQHPLPYTYQKPELWWQTMRKAQVTDFDQSPSTAVEAGKLERLFNAVMDLPATFKPLKKVEKLLQDKVKLFREEKKIDWATAELLAYASILDEGKDVRISGQDVKRGTFSHRHAVLRDESNDQPYSRLSRIKEGQHEFRIHNSLLSEYGVLGFEYGYAMANPQALVIWEAQFGDFGNGAQTIIDQFIMTAETKWQRMSGLVMMLPHGYEGQGPEHSSARMERFLQMCAENNVIVTNITTAANLFHALRRQLSWPFRKPLIQFSPKANLRHPGSYSLMEQFVTGGFREVIDDTTVSNADNISKVILCSGKIYFDLMERKEKENKKEVAIVRLEQIYPLPQAQLDSLHARYKKAIWYWVQEEPLNMGAATYLRMNLKNINFYILSRNASAATASGYSKFHAREQAAIIDKAFSI